MSPKIHQSFWSDPLVEKQSAETKLVLLWLITNSQTSILGICAASPRRFAFETGLPEQALEQALKALESPLFVKDGVVFLRNYVRHQFGSGDKLTSNNVFKSIVSAARSIKDQSILDAVLEEYPEIEPFLPQALQRALKPKEKEKEEEKEKEQERECEGEEAEDAERFFKDSMKQSPGYHRDARTVLHFLNEKSSRHYRETDENLGFISARLRESGVTTDGCFKMIERQCRKWLGTTQADYLRPQTLFNATKFDGYYAAKDQPIDYEPHQRTASPTPSEKRNAVMSQPIDAHAAAARDVLSKF